MQPGTPQPFLEALSTAPATETEAAASGDQAVPDDYHWSQGSTRFFNNYKNKECDRMIGDRRLRNWQEGKIQGVSRFLPSAYMLSVLEFDPSYQRLSICVSDRRDFYHQLHVPASRACTNGLWPLLRQEDIKDSKAFENFLCRASIKYDRTKHGDRLGQDHATKRPKHQPVLKHAPRRPSRSRGRR